MTITNFPKQNHKKSAREIAENLGVSIRTAQNYLIEMGVSKHRKQYLADAALRRKMAYELRETGLTWREVGEKLGISANNAQVLGHRHKKTLCKN